MPKEYFEPIEVLVNDIPLNVPSGQFYELFPRVSGSFDDIHRYDFELDGVKLSANKACRIFTDIISSVYFDEYGYIYDGDSEDITVKELVCIYKFIDRYCRSCDITKKILETLSENILCYLHEDITMFELVTFGPFHVDKIVCGYDDASRALLDILELNHVMEVNAKAEMISCGNIVKIPVNYHKGNYKSPNLAYNIIRDYATHKKLFMIADSEEYIVYLEKMCKYPDYIDFLRNGFHKVSQVSAEMIVRLYCSGHGTRSIPSKEFDDLKDKIKEYSDIPIFPAILPWMTGDYYQLSDIDKKDDE